MTWPEPYPDIQADERTTLSQNLDHWREGVLVKLEDLTLEEASAAALPATDLTVAGIVKHLAAVEDRWFHYRLTGHEMPEPWASAPADEPDWSLHLTPHDTIASIAELYRTACRRSRDAAMSLDSLEHEAPVPSFGIEPVTLRWVLVHMLVETACHTGHIELLRDEILRRRLPGLA